MPVDVIKITLSRKKSNINSTDEVIYFDDLDDDFADFNEEKN